MFLKEFLSQIENPKKDKRSLEEKIDIDGMKDDMGFSDKFDF